MTHHRGKVFVVGVWIAAVLAGCGGGKAAAPPTTPPPPPIAKAAFITKANAICTATEASLKLVEESVSGSPSQDQVVAFVTDHLIPATQSELAKIRALGTPTGDHGQLASILSAMETTLDHVLANPVQAVAETNPFAAVDARLRTYGLTSCAT